MKKLKALKNKKGFTLIELLTVIAILGILVLIAAPKFLGYTAQANEAHIKADIKTFENVIDSKLVLDQDAIENWPEIGKTELESYRDNGSLFTTEGLVEKDYQFNESYVDIPEEDFKKEFKSELSGNFIMDSGGEVYYHDETLTMGNDKNSSVNDNDEDENTVNNNDEDENTVVDNNDEDENTVVEEPEFTSENNFTWIANPEGYFTKEYPEKLGHYRYIGTGEEIVNIPHVIKGTEMTSYFGMFIGTGKDVKKVISTNPKVTDMSWMFVLSKATTLDLSSFNTSSVTDMNAMFKESQATSLDLSSFDTSSVTDMTQMFDKSKATSFDLSSFDTSSVTDMNGMFYKSQATRGYARSQADANRLNKSGLKPSNLTFITK